MKVYLSLLALLLSSQANAMTLIKSVDHFNEIDRIIHNNLRKHTADDTLLVFDVDDTLLTMPQDLGGVAWFDWQESLLKINSKHKMLTAKSFGELLNNQQALFAANHMQPSESGANSALREYQKQQIDILIETARGPEMQAVTEKELFYNQFTLSKDTLLMELEGDTSDDFKQPNIQACSKIKLNKYKYDNGVLYVSGQDKGYALDCLLSTTKHQYRSIIFVDDQYKNITQMCEHFPSKDVDLTCVHYRHNLNKQETFKTNVQRQQAADSAWHKFDS